MPLNKEYVRDGQRRIIGSVTTGFTGAFDTVVRDESAGFLGGQANISRRPAMTTAT